MFEHIWNLFPINELSYVETQFVKPKLTHRVKENKNNMPLIW